MIIDIIFAVLMLMALFKGIQRGLIVALFSLLAFFIGLAAALKLSAVVAVHLSEQTNLTGFWLPIISFLLVFFLVGFLVRLGARWVQESIEFVWLGWLNRLLGVLFYIVLYIIIFSILLFYATQIHLIKQETILASATYDFIEPWGPFVMNAFGKLFGVFSNMFTDLTDFFENFSKEL
ncbi:MAG TPA: CvpA family protein [Chitinophagaceae bacterium]|nr:CvpA family protein [Chitinophagaceae bacterium]